MSEQDLSRIEGEFFRGLNSLVEPLVRAGLGAPVFWPLGAIVLEVTGRNTGQRSNVPLLATRMGEFLLVSTYRRRSQWVKNIAANAEVNYWLAGRRYDATAFVFTPDDQASDDQASFDKLPPRAACLAGLLQRQSRLFGISFAILVPRD